jgi:hypothetical protein
LVLAFAGVGGGFALAFAVMRPRVLVSACIAAPIVLSLVLSRPAVQERAWARVHEVALKHWGYINTPGQTYRLMEPAFYTDRRQITAMTTRDVARYTLRAVWSYLTVPLPWQIESRSALAFLPEQVIWYTLIALMPIGVVVGLRRDPLLTCVLVTHALVAALIVAVSGGNVGTLVRHRGLAAPYLVWLSGLGAVHVARAVWSYAPSQERSRLVQPPEPKGGLPCL